MRVTSLYLYRGNPGAWWCVNQWFRWITHSTFKLNSRNTFTYNNYKYAQWVEKRNLHNQPNSYDTYTMFMQGSHAFIVYNNTSLLTTVLLFVFFFFFFHFQGRRTGSKSGRGELRPLCTVTTVIGCGHMPTAHLGGSGGMLPQKILEVSTLWERFWCILVAVFGLI